MWSNITIMAAKYKTEVKEENITIQYFTLLSGQSVIKTENDIKQIFYKELIFYIQL